MSEIMPTLRNGSGNGFGKGSGNALGKGLENGWEMTLGMAWGGDSESVGLGGRLREELRECLG